MVGSVSVQYLNDQFNCQFHWGGWREEVLRSCDWILELCQDLAICNDSVFCQRCCFRSNKLVFFNILRLCCLKSAVLTTLRTKPDSMKPNKRVDLKRGLKYFFSHSVHRMWIVYRGWSHLQWNFNHQAKWNVHFNHKAAFLLGGGWISRFVAM